MYLMKMPPLSDVTCLHCQRTNIVNSSAPHPWDTYRNLLRPDGVEIVMCGYCKGWMQFNPSTGEWGKCEVDSSAVQPDPTKPWLNPPLVLPFAPQNSTKPASNEAREWLKTNANPHPFATNHFPLAQDALAFVEKLYSLGAKEIVIEDPQDEDPGQYADSLYVILPEEEQTRKSIFECINSEIDEPDFKQEDTGQKELTLWWD